MSAVPLRALSLVAALGVAVPALAAEVEEAHGEATPNIFAGDVGNLFWTLLVFLLVLFVLGKYAWAPLSAFLKEREDFIRAALASAKADRDEAQRRLEEYAAKITGARAEATAIVEEGRRDAEVLRDRIEREAKAEAEATIERAKREIGIARDTAIKELYATSSKVAVEVAARIVGRELKADDHRRLIEDSIAELGRLETH